jgi:hypothetical protein
MAVAAILFSVAATVMVVVGDSHSRLQQQRQRQQQQQQAQAGDATADHIAPAAFWRFEDDAAIGANSAPASSATLNIVPGDGSSWTWAPMAEGGVVGGFVSLVSTAAATGGPVFNATAALTKLPHAAAGAASGFGFELLIKPGRDFNRAGNTTLMKITAPDSSLLIELALERHSISYRVDTGPAGAGKENCLEVPMDQVGRRTYFHLADGGWHHMAASLDLRGGGTLKLWIDGESPSGFSAALNLSTLATVSMAGTFQLLPQAFSGAIDEVALYTQTLSDNDVYAHSTRALKHHKPYNTASIDPGPAPPPASVIGVLDPKEFAPGTICKDWAHNCTPIDLKCDIHFLWANGSTKGTADQPSVIAQYKSYPLPRYNADALAAGLFPWCTSWANTPSEGINGFPSMYPDLSPQQMAEKWRDIQLEAGTNWRLPIYAELCTHGKMCTSNYTVELANSHPEIPLTFIMSRGGQTILWNTTHDTSINSASRKCFLQNIAGNLLSVDGVAMNMNTTLRPKSYGNGGIFRPCVTKECAAEAECPLEYLYKNDGRSWVTLFKEMKGNFTRPVNREAPLNMCVLRSPLNMSVWHRSY